MLIHDDLLATGGSAEAAALLIQKVGGVVFGFNFLVELGFLNGADRLQNETVSIHSIVKY